jgi:hypothetical protein
VISFFSTTVHYIIDPDAIPVMVACGGRINSRRVTHSPARVGCPACLAWLRARGCVPRRSHSLASHNRKSMVHPEVVLSVGMSVERYLEQFRGIFDIKCRQQDSKAGIKVTTNYRPISAQDIDDHRAILLHGGQRGGASVVQLMPQKRRK